MKFKIRDAKKKEPCMELYLEEAGDSVYLNGIDAKGNAWSLIEFPNNSCPRRVDGIGEDAGLEVDKDGCILID